MKTSVGVEFWDGGKRSTSRSANGFRSDKRAQEDIQTLPRRMWALARRVGGRKAKQKHAYRNQTHNLERSTDAYLTRDTPTEVEVRLEPLAEYAKYVAARGYLDMTEAGEATERALDALFDDFET